MDKWINRPQFSYEYCNVRKKFIKNEKNKKEAKKIEEQREDFLKKNPKIKKALQIFDITYDQYEKSLSGRVNFYTGTSTN